MTKKFFDDCGGISNIEERPLLYTSFMTWTPEDVPVYNAVNTYDVGVAGQACWEAWWRCS